MFLNGRVLPWIFSVSCPDLYAPELPRLYLYIPHSLGKLKTTSLPTLLLQQMGAGALCCWWYTDSCTLLPGWDAGAGIAGLDDSSAVILTLLCLTPHHSVPVKTFIHLCHEIWQQASSMVFIYLFIFSQWCLRRALSDCLLCVPSCHVNADLCSSVWQCSQSAECLS